MSENRHARGKIVLRIAEDQSKALPRHKYKSTENLLWLEIYMISDPVTSTFINLPVKRGFFRSKIKQYIMNKFRCKRLIQVI